MCPVVRVRQSLHLQDRFRVVTFASQAQELIPYTPATKENVVAACNQVAGLAPRDSTNLYAGLQIALSGLDDDRATSITLVTDA